jgi:hypothetical protein
MLQNSSQFKNVIDGGGNVNFRIISESSRRRQNSAIFEPDYRMLSIERTNILREKLMEKTLHPKRIEYWLENGLTIDDI